MPEIPQEPLLACDLCGSMDRCARFTIDDGVAVALVILCGEHKMPLQEAFRAGVPAVPGKRLAVPRGLDAGRLKSLERD